MTELDARAVLDRLGGRLVGRKRELELVLAALDAGRHVLIEGPPGTGKSTLLRAVADELGVGFEFVEGNAELTPARLVGHFDPARVLAEGYDPDVFVDGALVTAMRDGSLLYVEELNRVPEETLNVLITVMSERELHVPRLGRVVADPGLPAGGGDEPVRRRRHGPHLQRHLRPGVPPQRRLPVGRRGSGHRRARRRPAPTTRGSARSSSSSGGPARHPDLRVGSSVRGALDATAVVSSLAALRDQPVTTPSVSLDAVLMALSGRVRLREGCLRIVGGDHHRAVGGDLRRHPPGRRRRRRVHGKSPGPDGGFPFLKEGPQAAAAIDDAKRSTVSRRSLARHAEFDQVSPEVGQLDEAAFDDAMAEDADEAMAMLADMTRATDAALRELARRLAGRLVLDVARRGPARPRGSGRIAAAPYQPDAGDLDIDASTEAIVEARAARSAVDPERLRVRRWVQPRTAVCLLVDRSGSMSGKPLATNAVAAAAVAFRSPDDFSVVSFAKDSVVVKSQDVPTDGRGRRRRRARPARPRHHRSRRAPWPPPASSCPAPAPAARSRSCCRTAGPPSRATSLVAAAALEELAIVAPEGDSEAAEELANAVGAALTTVAGPATAADALTASSPDIAPFPQSAPLVRGSAAHVAGRDDAERVLGRARPRSAPT